MGTLGEYFLKILIQKVAASTKMQPCQEKSKRSHPVITSSLPKSETLYLIL
jgi:hypothetical protein